MSAAAAAIHRRAAAAGDLVVSELFTSLQGEGPSAGQTAVFVRLGGCNLDCSWCDTPYTWRWDRHDPRAELSVRPVADVVRQVLEQRAPRVVVTGGEPLLQQRALLELVALLHEAGRLVEIETNGTIAPAPRLVEGAARFNVSPKLATSGVRAGRRIVPDSLTALAGTGKAVFKFVVTDPGADVPEVEELAASYGMESVWLMPQGTSGPEVVDGMRALAEAAVPRGWSVSPRLHVLLWGDARGR
ncbi:7-carboxy-7-deazaguanine synthase QueE [Streptomyces sp. S1A]|uniref:7-carboxy-7-deazaguanine synthase QueE n=1 Tax=Streptomyces sp. ICN903 TaxID=2964654 RepID=UPI001EDAF049|nr:7-carboxy-7-deazaguanine synthase QueE [Streptomyces sp. ICN903]MCG3038993.1 7-carboxy-7-deazaguanine synthase QueE [Streptomyces sp. ICN903]